MNRRQAIPKQRYFSYLYCSAIILSSALPALAADAPQANMRMMDCATVKNNERRLLCFDKAATALKTTRFLRRMGTAHLKEIVANPGQTTLNLDVASGTFIDRLVEIRNVRRLYSTDGYRCVAHRRGTAPVVFAQAVEPAAEQERLKIDCALLDSLLSAACKRNIRIVTTDYRGDFSRDFAKGLVLKVPTIEIVAASPPKR
ncbi:hypothetical protein [Bradyrhizobium australafricanum]|uniref:hypothetical protein n=1 Tax=Bradyrhizobium australafricanum TaxID=2821406 RepID=UPI001CE23962|nr:hypothetical protein [Bradyrhizobium australafricanum]MCA6105429.1 hypothetical protein [Bradyrhizobium australafricanum]